MQRAPNVLPRRAKVAVGSIGAEVLAGTEHLGHSVPDRRARVYLLVFLKEQHARLGADAATGQGTGPSGDVAR
jgi:hypothetical protein